MATLALPSEPTLTMSVSRYTNPTAPRVSDTLPPLNFAFDDLRNTMNAFTKRFDAFIASSRASVLASRQEFRTQLSSVNDTTRQAQNKISQLEAKAETLKEGSQAQIAETKEMQGAIDELTRQRDTQREGVESTRTRLQKLKTDIATRRSAQREHQQYIAQQAGMNKPEIEGWEENLQLRVEGTGRDDVVKFVFMGCDPGQPTREAWFELDMRGEKGRGYDMGACKPRLDQREVDKAVTRMCEDEKLGLFLQDMRNLFVKVMS